MSNSATCEKKGEHFNPINIYLPQKKNKTHLQKCNESKPEAVAFIPTPMQLFNITQHVITLGA